MILLAKLIELNENWNTLLFDNSFKTANILSFSVLYSISWKFKGKAKITFLVFIWNLSCPICLYCLNGISLMINLISLLSIADSYGTILELKFVYEYVKGFRIVSAKLFSAYRSPQNQEWFSAIIKSCNSRSRHLLLLKFSSNNSINVEDFKYFLMSSIRLSYSFDRKYV